ncbi:MAG: agmatine deiminase family protein [Pseudomonadota bacterium]|nr:agmatine deiminase family protein [Pseudomonadota bacterium]
MIKTFAEWQPQDAVLIAWPHKSTDWAPYLEEAYQCYTRLAAAISRYQPCLILCQDRAHQTQIHDYLAYKALMRNIRYIPLPYNDTWTRDYGPIATQQDQQLTLVDCQFNAWGDKFEANLDNQINQRMAQLELFNCEVKSTNLTFEDGSMESNGQGVLLATYFCLKQRYPDLSQNQIEAKLTAVFGFDHFLWLTEGHLAGDDTDAHIDTLARFIDPNTIAYVQCQDPNDEHYLALQAMEQQLKAFRTPEGQPYQLVSLPFAPAIFAEDGHRLPATYANFLILNSAILMPTYRAETDQQAIEVLHQVTKKPVVGVDCRVLIEQHGSLHCATMQLPKHALNFERLQSL